MTISKFRFGVGWQEQCRGRSGSLGFRPKPGEVLTMGNCSRHLSIYINGFCSRTDTSRKILLLRIIVTECAAPVTPVASLETGFDMDSHIGPGIFHLEVGLQVIRQVMGLLH
jgi:hypothetical protein